jgi:fatty acid desaturase
MSITEPAPAQAAPERRGSDYAELSVRVRAAGLLRRRPLYYATAIGLVLTAYAAAIVAFALIGDSWYQLVVAVVLAVVFTQVAYFGHDAGHRQILRSKRANAVIGLVLGNLLIGLGHNWWVAKHNRHHAHPNQVGEDPDIGVGVLVWTQDDARARRGWIRFITRHQAALFFPLLLLEGLNLHVSSFRGIRDRRTGVPPLIDGLLLVLHVAGYVTGLLLVLSPAKALAFLLLQQALFGLYMGCSFAPNHKGMPLVPADAKIDFLRRQVLTSRNVRGGSFIDIALGGLNYQIEHHLFPSMPRPALRRCQVLVRDYCRELGVPYAETGAVASYREALRAMHEVGAPLREPAAD